MGGGSFSSSAWSDYSSKVADKSADTIYNAPKAHAAFVPSAIKVREAFDNNEHPNSTPLILGLDVTGSMGSVLETAAKRIGVLMLDMLKRGTITDPQIASMAIGDVIAGDKYPLQFTQFESDNRCVDQLTGLHFERGGGGNDNESYSLAWIAGAYLVDSHAWTKRQKKGYLITIGDENPTAKLSEAHIRHVFPDENLVPCPQGGIDAKTALELAEQKWHCFHIIVREGNHIRHHGLDFALTPWRELMGQRVIVLDDINDLSEVITSIIEVNEGRDVDDVAKSWDGSTAITVRNAVSGIVPAGTTVGDTGIVKLA